LDRSACGADGLALEADRDSGASKDGGWPVDLKGRPAVKILLNAEQLASVGGVEMSMLQVGQELANRGHNPDLL
jgi:hypothetical protein